MNGSKITQGNSLGEVYLNKIILTLQPSTIGQHLFDSLGYLLETIFRSNRTEVLTPQNGQTRSNDNSRQIVWVCLTILWGWRLKGSKAFCKNLHGNKCAGSPLQKTLLKRDYCIDVSLGIWRHFIKSLSY